MRDFFIGWHERFQPLGPALKTPRIEVDEKAPLSDFETRSYDHPSCTGGNAPPLSPQALVPSPAAQRELRVGDRVRCTEDRKPWIGIVTEVDVLFCGSRFYADVAREDEPDRIGTCDVGYLELLPPQPSDTQQWVEWKGGPCPVSAGTRVEVRYRDGAPAKFTSTGAGSLWAYVLSYRVVQ